MKRCFLGVLFLAWCFSLSISAQDAVMFRGDLKHTGVYSATSVPKLNGVKWKFHTGGSVISSPAVVNGVAYVGSKDESLYAVDAGSGALKMEVRDEELGGFVTRRWFRAWSTS